MRRLHPSVLIVSLLLPLSLAAGCGQGEDPAAQGEAAEAELDGLSREEISRQAEAMSPEQAEQLGIVDTTIHLETLTNPSDSALAPDTIRLSTPDTTP